MQCLQTDAFSIVSVIKTDGGRKLHISSLSIIPTGKTIRERLIEDQNLNREWDLGFHYRN